MRSSSLLAVGALCCVIGLFNVAYVHIAHDHNVAEHAANDFKARHFRRGTRGNIFGAINDRRAAKQRLRKTDGRRDEVADAVADAVMHPKQGKNMAARPDGRETSNNNRAEGAASISDGLSNKGSAVGRMDDEKSGNDLGHPLAGLNCADHGGPSNDIAEEMVFWSDIPGDSAYRSPFLGEEEKFLTFEPDHGGWNNIRMAMETVLVMAHAMGRTLVLPPEQKMYLLNKDAKKHKTEFTFNDFFHIDAIAMEHEGFNVISMEEFLARQGMAGKLVNKKTGTPMKPPHDRVNWNSQPDKDLEAYLRAVGITPEWDPWKCVFAVPASTDPKDVDALNKTVKEILSGKNGRKPKWEDFVGKPVPVDAPMEDRMREMVADRDEGLCIYDAELQNAPLIHFKNDQKSRLLTHFYAFIFFADWKQDLWSKRFVRDHLRYIDEVVCAAARIVNKVRERSRALDPVNNTAGLFDAMHVRRGDFQFKPTRLDADVLHEKSKKELTEGATLYIATDERDKSFFKPIAEHYDICYMDDFMDEIKGLNSNYYGMIDQLVASKARVFYGTWWSTLSGYVNRMRGYYIAKHKLEGYEDGTMQSYYFFPDERKMQMREYMPVRKPIYMREFPSAWRDIEKGMEDLHAEIGSQTEKK